MKSPSIWAWLLRNCQGKEEGSHRFIARDLRLIPLLSSMGPYLFVSKKRQEVWGNSCIIGRIPIYSILVYIVNLNPTNMDKVAYTWHWFLHGHPYSFSGQKWKWLDIPFTSQFSLQLSEVLNLVMIHMSQCCSWIYERIGSFILSMPILSNTQWVRAWEELSAGWKTSIQMKHQVSFSSLWGCYYRATLAYGIYAKDHLCPTKAWPWPQTLSIGLHWTIPVRRGKENSSSE